MLVLSGLQATNLCRNIPCLHSLKQMVRQMKSRDVLLQRAPWWCQKIFLKSELEEGKCARKVQQNGLKLPSKELCAGRAGAMGTRGKQRDLQTVNLTLIEGKIGKDGEV